MSLVGLDLVTNDVEQLGEETWLVPHVNVSMFDDDDNDTVPKREFDCLLLELRDNLTKRRVAEEELEKLKYNFDNLTVNPSETKLPMSDGSVKTRARSGSRRRRTLTRIPGPAAVVTGVAGVTDQDDDWSEPDKAESRRRIGLEEDEVELGEL